MPPSTSAKIAYLRFPDEALHRRMLAAVTSPSSLTDGLTRGVNKAGYSEDEAEGDSAGIWVVPAQELRTALGIYVNPEGPKQSL